MERASESYTTAEVAAQAGVHRDTLLRWLRSGLVPEPARDRRGWRVFTMPELGQIVEFANATSVNESPYGVKEEHIPDPTINALDRIDWNFDGAKTSYLTHSLHPYPAKFIPQIPNALIQALSSVGDTVGDIFCGSGTTLVEAQLLKRHAVGIDANPLAALISRTKLARLTEQEFTALRELCDWVHDLAESFSDPTPNLFSSNVDGLESVVPSDEKLEFWFDEHVVSELGAILFKVKQLETETAQTVASAALSSIIVAVSRQDSDTRYVRRTKNIKTGETAERFAVALSRSLRMLAEYLDATELRFSAQVIAANVLDKPRVDKMDLMVCSPPYPNAYSYHLYHRTRMSWLGMDQPKFKAEEIGSHRKYSAKKTTEQKLTVFKGEMKTILSWLRDHLTDNAHACFVVGDSTIGGETIDNAKLIAEAATEVGYTQRHCVTRTLQATKKSFNPKIGKIKKEKILILRKV